MKPENDDTPKHTPEPWAVHGEYVNHGTLRLNLGQFRKESDAARSVECVNALARIPYPQDWVNGVKYILDKLLPFEHPDMKVGDSKIDFLIKRSQELDNIPASPFQGAINELLYIMDIEQGAPQPYPDTKFIKTAEDMHKWDGDKVVEVVGEVARITYNGRKGVVYFSIDFTETEDMV